MNISKGRLKAMTRFDTKHMDSYVAMVIAKKLC